MQSPYGFGINFMWHLNYWSRIACLLVCMSITDIMLKMVPLANYFYQVSTKENIALFFKQRESQKKAIKQPVGRLRKYAPESKGQLQITKNN